MADYSIKIFNKRALRMTVLPDLDQFQHWLTQFSTDVDEIVENLLFNNRIDFQPDGTEYQIYFA